MWYLEPFRWAFDYGFDCLDPRHQSRWSRNEDPDNVRTRSPHRQVERYEPRQDAPVGPIVRFDSIRVPATPFSIETCGDGGTVSSACIARGHSISSSSTV